MIGEDELIERLQEVCAEFGAKYPLKTGTRYLQLVETSGPLTPTHIRTVWVDGPAVEMLDQRYLW